MIAANPHAAVLTAVHRAPESRALVVVDLRGYRRHRGYLLYADRVLVRGRWTPFVRVRVRRPRAADGATEI